jgi:hypothetical protein
MHQAESSSSLFCLWTGHSLRAALHPVSRRRNCLPLRTDQFPSDRDFHPIVGAYFQAHCSCPFGTERSGAESLLIRLPHFAEAGLGAHQCFPTPLSFVFLCVSVVKFPSVTSYLKFFKQKSGRNRAADKRPRA